MAKRRRARPVISGSTNNMIEKVGSWSFIIGLVIAIVIGAIGGRATNLLLLLGLIVGLINITGKEIVPFLVATIGLIVAGSVASTIGLPLWLVGILDNVSIFVVPGALVAAIKAIYAIGYTK